MIFKKGTLREHATEILFLFRLVDLLTVLAVGLITFVIIMDRMPIHTEKLYFIVALSYFALFAEWLGIYRSARGRSISSELLRVLLISFFTFSAMFLTNRLTADAEAFTSSRLNDWLMLWFFSLSAVLTGMRITLRKLLGWVRKSGWNQRHIVLVGATPNAGKIADAVSKYPEFGIHIDGYFDDRKATRDEIPEVYTRLGAIKDLAEYVNKHNIDQVWIAYPFKGEGRGKEVLDELRHSTVNIRYILDLNAFKNSEKTLTEFGGLPLLDIDVSPLEGTAIYIKALEDKVLSAFALILLSPLFLILAIGVKLSSPGPVFYRQERISWNNKPFMMLKFRSMPVDSEKDGVSWGGARNKKPTKFGAFLRKTSLDELPQFINVFKGEMSIIGPRPERTVFVDKFKDEIPEYMKKHMVKAGITGWAQVNGLRGDTDLQKRIEYDLFYIKNWSLGFDIKIAIQTIFKGFINKNAY